MGHDDRPDAVVGFSGSYDFLDRTPAGSSEDSQNTIENYTNTCVRLDPNGGHNDQVSAFHHWGELTAENGDKTDLRF